MKQKVVVILGPTAVGKSALAVRLAKKLARHKWGGFDGAEIISADSRQLYKGLDIGTGKIKKYEMRGVPHHLLDVASPKGVFTVAKFKTLAEKIVADILRRGKLPIICGGTGFYISALLGEETIPDVPPNKKLRGKLAGESADTLLKMLRKLDPRRAKEIDPHNKVRLIRAIEIAKVLGKVPHLGIGFPSGGKYDTLQIGIDLTDKDLRDRIEKRLLEQLRRGMVGEVKQLRKQGVSWQRLYNLGLEYRYVSKYLRKFPRLSASSPHLSALREELEGEIWHYAKRQRTWFRRDKRVKWFESSQISDIQKVVRNFIG